MTLISIDKNRTHSQVDPRVDKRKAMPLTMTSENKNINNNT